MESMMQGGEGEIQFPPEWNAGTRFGDILTEEERQEFLGNEKPTDDGPSAETMLNFTAAEMMGLVFGTIGLGMASSMDMTQNDVKRINASWLPYISVVNQTEVPAVGRMTLDDWWKTKTTIVEIEGVDLQPGQIGRFPLPQTFDIARDYPHNHLLNDRTIDLGFADGRSLSIKCFRMNQGRSKTSVAVQDNNGVLTIVDLNEIQEQKPDEKPESAAGLSLSVKMLKFMSFGQTLNGDIEMMTDQVTNFLTETAEVMDQRKKEEREAERIEANPQ